MKPTKTTTLGKAVAAKRGTRPLRDLARELKEPHSSIQFVETGRMPGPRLFVKLARWLDLIDWTTSKKLMPYTQGRKEKANGRQK